MNPYMTSVPTHEGLDAEGLQVLVVKVDVAAGMRVGVRATENRAGGFESKVQAQFHHVGCGAPTLFLEAPDFNHLFP